VRPRSQETITSTLEMREVAEPEMLVVTDGELPTGDTGSLGLAAAPPTSTLGLRRSIRMATRHQKVARPGSGAIRMGECPPIAA